MDRQERLNYRLTDKLPRILILGIIFVAISVVGASAANWYVNDTDATGDVYTSAIGSDTAGDGSETLPYRTIAKAMSMVGAGDTVYVDAGIYQEEVEVDTDYLTLTGADSALTIIDFGDTTWLTGAQGIYADTQTGLRVLDLQIRLCRIGIEWSNVDQSRIENVYSHHNGNLGINLHTNSDTNTLVNITSNNHYHVFRSVSIFPVFDNLISCD